MTNNCDSSDLKAEAIIETIPKSCKVNENSIVKYIVTQQPATDTNLTEILKKFDTFAPYKTSILVDAFSPFSPISEDQRPKYNPQANQFNGFGVSGFEEEQTVNRSCLEYCVICLTSIFERACDG